MGFIYPHMDDVATVIYFTDPVVCFDLSCTIAVLH